MSEQRIKVIKAAEMAEQRNSTTISMQEETVYFNCSCGHPNRTSFRYENGFMVTRTHHDRHTHESPVPVKLVLRRLFATFAVGMLEWVIREATKELLRKGGKLDRAA